MQDARLLVSLASPSRTLRTGWPALHRRVGTLIAIAVVGLLLIAQPAPASAGMRSLSLSPGRSTAAPLDQSVANGTVGASFVIPKLAGGAAYLGVELRSQSNAMNYRARVRVHADRSLRVSILRGEQVLLSEPIPGMAAAGQTIRVQGSVTGTTSVRLAVRAWVVGTTPPDWQQRFTDASVQRISTAGQARVRGYLSASAPRGVEVDYHDTAVSGVPAPAVPAAPVAPVAPNPPAPVNPAPPAPAVPEQTGKPSAATTGVPAGTQLTTHYGDITITKAGTHLDKMDIHGFVVVRAPDVEITRSIVRGGTTTHDQGLITDYGSPNLLVEDVDLKADHPSVWVDGLKGWDFTARRVHIVGNVDSIKVHGDNVRIEDSLLENTDYYQHDPNLGGAPTHNDGVQVINGRNIIITGNTIRGQQNFPVLGAANHDDVPNLRVEGNWLDGGHCTLKFQTLNGHALTATAINNKFGPHREVKNCPIQAEPDVKLTARDNVYEDSGLPVNILRVES